MELQIIFFQEKSKQPWCLCYVSLIISRNHCVFAIKSSLSGLCSQSDNRVLPQMSTALFFSLPNEIQKLNEREISLLCTEALCICLRTTYWDVEEFLFRGKCLFQFHLCYRSLSSLVPILHIIVTIWEITHECNICQHVSNSCKSSWY